MWKTWLNSKLIAQPYSTTIDCWIDSSQNKISVTCEDICVQIMFQWAQNGGWSIMNDNIGSAFSFSYLTISSWLPHEPFYLRCSSMRRGTEWIFYPLNVAQCLTHSRYSLRTFEEWVIITKIWGEILSRGFGWVKKLFITVESGYHFSTFHLCSSPNSFTEGNQHQQ